MKKIPLFIFIFILTACSPKVTPKTPHELLLSIKDYSCKMQISYFSNKNQTEYSAIQTYSGIGKYSMEFSDEENLKINYENRILDITSKPVEKSITMQNYPESNRNPLFLSYFINTYFNSEEPNKAEFTENSVHITLPNHNEYLYSAKLTFENNLPHTLTYFDENGNIKVNIIYNEFTFI